MECGVVITPGAQEMARTDTAARARRPPVRDPMVQSLFSYIRPGYIHSGYNRDHGGTTEPERSRNVKLKRTCHPVFVLDLTQNDLLGVG